MKRAVHSLVTALALAAIAPLLSGCSGVPAGTTGGGPVALAEGWAKSAAAGGMTGVFGTLTNHGTAPLSITGIESDAAGEAELHEVTAEGVMQEKAGGATLAPGEPFELSPGRDHVMLMGLGHDLLPGDDVTFALRFSDGSTQSYTVPVKDYAGANESYEHGDGHGTDH